MIFTRISQKISLLLQGVHILKLHYHLVSFFKQCGISTQKFNRKFYSVAWYTKHYYMCQELEDRLFRLLQLTAGKTKEEVAYLLRSAERKKAFHESICLEDFPPSIIQTLIASPTGKDILQNIAKHKQSISAANEFYSWNKRKINTKASTETSLTDTTLLETPFYQTNDNPSLIEKTWP